MEEALMETVVEPPTEVKAKKPRTSKKKKVEEPIMEEALMETVVEPPAEAPKEVKAKKPRTSKKKKGKESSEPQEEGMPPLP
jgi:hypothetical protein